MDELRKLAQIMLIDSRDEQDVERLLRADSLTNDTYVVDLAWLRSTPWRSDRGGVRLAAPAAGPEGDQRRARPPPRGLARVRAAVLRLARLPARVGAGSGHAGRGRWTGSAHTRRQDIELTLQPVDMSSPGLAGVTIELASGQAVSLDRSPGGLRAMRRDRDGTERAWTVMGASRGEGGILGEGVRQALLRDPTYRPALKSAEAMVV